MHPIVTGSKPFGSMFDEYVPQEKVVMAAQRYTSISKRWPSQPRLHALPRMQTPSYTVSRAWHFINAQSLRMRDIEILEAALDSIVNAPYDLIQWA